MSTELDLLEVQHRWPLIARDLVLMAQPGCGSSYTLSDVAQHYDLTTEQLTALMQLPSFENLLKSEMARVKAMGPSAGFRLRAEILAGDLQERLYLRAQSGDMEDKQMLQLLAILMRSAGIDTPAEPISTASAPAVNISFNIPKLPTNRKLAHLMKQPQTNVIDLES